MRVTLADSVVQQLEGLRLLLDYDTLTDVVNLVLDAIKHNWDLQLQNSQTRTQTVQGRPKITIQDRHRDWLTEYGTKRGLSVPNAANLVISEFFLGKTSQIEFKKPTAVQPVQETKQEEQKTIPTDKPKGNTLLKLLKL